MEKGIAQIKVTECKNFGQGKNEREHILIFYEWLTVLDSMEDHTRKPSVNVTNCFLFVSSFYKGVTAAPQIKTIYNYSSVITKHKNKLIVLPNLVLKILRYQMEENSSWK